jgi:hypothetical protein
MKRFEILLPLDYNDGTRIKREKLDQTAEELSNRFEAITQDTTGIVGSWKYGAARYRDRLLRIRVDRPTLRRLHSSEPTKRL